MAIPFLALASTLANAAMNDEPSCAGIHTPHTNKYYGPTKCDGVTLSYLEVAGALWLEKSKITGTLSTQGVVKISNSTIDGNITGAGLFTANDSAIKSTLDQSGKIIASNTSFKNIIMESEIEASTISLAVNSTVQGDITFKGKAGTVYLKSGSSISGTVHNGSIVRQ